MRRRRREGVDGILGESEREINANDNGKDSVDVERGGEGRREEEWGRG